MVSRLAAQPACTTPNMVRVFGALEPEVRELANLARLLTSYVVNSMDACIPEKAASEWDAVVWAASKLVNRADALNRNYLALLRQPTE
jgi:hypothetical protein